MMDYFLSADIMEHPYRTRLVPHNEPYSEQVLLTEGQGIWYFRPVDPAIELRKANMTGMVGNVIHYRRSDFNLSDDWFIYLLPQSTFKIHPLYDHVLEEILIQNPTAHLVVTGGRRPLWTALYQERLSSIFGPELMKRFHVIERVSSENFYEFLKLGDAVLHPFPFDGSRTSADALIVEKPYVTLPTEYLRGRMGFAFLRNMNIPELVARDIPDYIQIASRLAKDKLFYQTVVGKIRQNVDLIWEDMQVPYDATRFFQRLLDFPVSSYESFLKSTGRNVAQDLQRTQIRERNALAFDTAFGKQTWPLDEEGKLVMEAYIDGAERWPRIFEYWKRYQAPHRNWKAHPSFENITNAAARGFDPSQYIDKVSSARQRKAESHQLEQDQIAAASRDKSPAIARAPKLVEENHKPRLARLRELLREQNFEEAFPVAVELFPFYKDDPYFLTEVGALQYYRGEYLEAFSMCQTAAALFAANNKAQESIESNACMGVSGSYLPEKGREAVDALLTAYNLNIAWQEDRERLGLPVLRNHSFFVVTLDSIESNLISALDSSQRFDDCVAVTEQIYDVAARTLFGTYVIVFSVVKWSLANRDVIDEIERNLMLDPTVRLSRRSNTASLWDQIRYLQGRATDAINHIIPCYVRSPSYSPIYNQATEELFETLSRIDTRRAQQQGKMVSAYVAPKRGVVLITQYFDATTKLQQEEINVKIDVEKVKIMQEDMNFVLTKNLMNPYIEDIFMLTEQFVNFTSFPNSNKIKQYVLGNRLTFRDAFLFSNQYIADRVVVLGKYISIYTAVPFTELFFCLLHSQCRYLLRLVIISIVCTIYWRGSSPRKYDSCNVEVDRKQGFYLIASAHRQSRYLDLQNAFWRLRWLSRTTSPRGYQ